MAIIPPDQKFHTVPAEVDTKDRGSARANADRDIYTMQDIIDSITGGGAVDDVNGETGSVTLVAGTGIDIDAQAGTGNIEISATGGGETSLDGQIVSYTLRDVPFDGFSDGEYEGETIDLGNNFGGVQQAGLIYYWTGTQWDLASNAAPSSASPLIGVLTNKLTNGNFQTVLLSGVVRMKAQPSGITTNNEVLYLSTAGGTTATPPGAGTTMRVVGRSFSASNPNRIHFDPSKDFFEL